MNKTKLLTTTTILILLSLILLPNIVYAEKKVYPITSKDTDIVCKATGTWTVELTTSCAKLSNLGGSGTGEVDRHSTTTWIPVNQYVFVDFKKFKFSSLQNAYIHLIVSTEYGQNHTILKCDTWDNKIVIQKKVNGTDTDVKTFTYLKDDWNKIVALGLSTHKQPKAVTVFEDGTYKEFDSATDVWYLPVYGFHFYLNADVYTYAENVEVYNIVYADTIKEYVSWLKTNVSTRSMTDLTMQIIPVIFALAIVGMAIGYMKRMHR